MKKYFLPILITLSALAVSASAAFYSVSGLGKLFAGASMEVMVMAASLEVSKLVIASLLYQYWNKINGILKTYLTIAALVLVGITSAGIYGFLSGAYQETANKDQIVSRGIEVLEVRKERLEESRLYLEGEKQELSQSIKELRNGLANNTIQYKDRETGQIITTTSSATRRALQKELENALTRQDGVSVKIEEVVKDISDLEVEILQTKANADTATELGPLKYLSELTGKPMDKIINWFILAIIFVFDPLAISLVLAANVAFTNLSSKEEDEEENEVNDTLEGLSFDEDEFLDMPVRVDEKETQSTEQEIQAETLPTQSWEWVPTEIEQEEDIEVPLELQKPEHIDRSQIEETPAKKKFPSSRRKR